jgi:hypothetical protein
MGGESGIGNNGRLEGSAVWRIAGFLTTGTLIPQQKTLWRIESISMYGGSVSGLR